MLFEILSLYFEEFCCGEMQLFSKLPQYNMMKQYFKILMRAILYNFS